MNQSKMIKRPLNLLVVGAACWRYWLMVMILALLPVMVEAQVSLNVQNFGAKGDAVQFYANTVSNSDFITTTNIFSIADIGKAIEVFKCGTNTSGTNCQDMVTTIANVVNGTNIYLNQICQNTLTNTFATVGTDNSLAFSNAIQSVVNSHSANTIINVPAGKYLCLAQFIANAGAPMSILTYGGGWHLVGDGMTNTVLIGQGAWTLRTGYGAMRGFLLAIKPPVANDYPVSIENLTLDGGVEQGNTSRHGFPASAIDGEGWDMTHDAIDIRGFSGNAITRWTWKDLLFTHWRGEIVKSNGQAHNGNLLIEDCIFRDGNATAINIYDSLVITNCVFDNMFQIGEYYQEYSTNANYMVGNLFTNITGNGMAINGGKGSNPAFVISNNIFVNISGDGVLTTPGDNIIVASNQFLNVAWPIVIGAPGYQGTFINSNITVNFNTFSNSSVVFQIGDSSSASSNICSDVRIYGNTSTVIRGSYLQCAWAYNVSFYSNTVALASDGTTIIGTTIATGKYGAPFPLVDTNNLAWTRLLFASANQVVPISYGQGACFQFVYRTLTNSALALVTTNASQIPLGATMIITNSSFIDASSSGILPVYLNSNLSGDPVVIGQNEARTFYWNKVKGGYAWMTHPIIPPLNLRTNL